MEKNREQMTTELIECVHKHIIDALISEIDGTDEDEMEERFRQALDSFGFNSRIFIEHPEHGLLVMAFIHYYEDKDRDWAFGIYREALMYIYETILRHIGPREVIDKIEAESSFVNIIGS